MGLVILSVVVGWLAGQYQGQEIARVQLSEVQSLADEELSRLRALSSRQQLELQQTILARNIADSRAAALQSELDESMQSSVDDAAELALYRRIAGASQKRGVWIDQVSLVEGKPDLLAITLVQSRGRDRAVGRIGVALSGGGGDPDRYWVVTDSRTGVVVEKRDGKPQFAASDTNMTEASDDVFTIEAFDLRFFQTVLVKVKNITTIDPDYVEILVQPDGMRLKPSVQRFRWAEIRS